MNQLQEFRLSYGFSRQKMANLMNISISQYNKVEFKQRAPSYNFLKKLKEVFPKFDVNIFFEQKK